MRDEHLAGIVPAAFPSHTVKSVSHCECSKKFTAAWAWSGHPVTTHLEHYLPGTALIQALRCQDGRSIILNSGSCKQTRHRFVGSDDIRETDPDYFHQDSMGNNSLL
jgi:hypothetical protein